MKWNSEDLFVGDVIFIIIIIINIVVSLPSCLLFNESKVLDTSLTEVFPLRWTDGGEDSSTAEGGWELFVSDCDGAIGRQTFGFGALFRVNTLPIYRSNTPSRTPSVYCIFIVQFHTEVRYCPLIMFVSDSSLLSWKGM